MNDPDRRGLEGQRVRKGAPGLMAAGLAALVLFMTTVLAVGLLP